MSAKTKKNTKSTYLGFIDKAKSAIIPYNKNDYRPHLIRRYGLLMITIMVIGSQLCYKAVLADTASPIKSDITINTLFNKTNDEREKAGKKLLTLNKKLNIAAYSKVQDMFKHQYWSHISPDGVKPWKWLDDAGYKYSEAGENLAKNYTSTDAVMTAWMNSPEHKENILNPDYEDVGFAVSEGEYKGQSAYFIVAFYGLSIDSATSNIETSFVSAITGGPNNIVAQFNIALKSITPVGVASLILIAVAIIVSILAHMRSNKLPKKLRNSYYRHHGLYKTGGLLLLGILTVLLSNGGQI